MDQYRFKLTPAGWLEGLSASGALESLELLGRCQRLMHAIKAATDANPTPLVDLFFRPHDVASEEMPVGWIDNALSSRLLSRTFLKAKINHRLDARNVRQFRIAADFGRQRI